MSARVRMVPGRNGRASLGVSAATETWGAT
jgi:hypothetical protein